MMITLWAAGCVSVPETRFYTLSEPPEIKVRPRDLSTPIFIDILPVNVPERLARPQLVVRYEDSGPETQLFILEQDRWSSPFNYELRDAFASGIANWTGAVNKAHRSRTSDQIVYRIAIELSQFDAIIDDSVKARFSWTITRPADARSVACYAVITEPVSAGVEGVVGGVQRAVTSVVTSISKNVLELDMGRVPTCAAQK
ncbi:PqiC family protein [Nitrosospira multiformis]|nr:PqiC family protein [Nitrosospira multiformis]